MLNAPIRPKSIVAKSIPPPGARVVMCIQQTSSSGQRAANDCRAYVPASGGKGGVTGTSLHAMVMTYIGGDDYGTLYARDVSPESDLAKLSRGPLVGKDDSAYGQFVVKDDRGNYLLYLELERH